MYKACIFDLDGTLTDSLESLTYSVNLMLKELGYNSITSKQCESFVGNGAKVLVEKALAAAGDRKLQHAEDAHKIYARVFDEHCTRGVVTYPGVSEMVTRLKDNGCKLAVLSNKPHRQTVKVIEAIFGVGTFDEVQGQQEGIKRKPDPEGVYVVADKLGVSIEACAYVGDSEVDIATGKAARVDTIGVTWGFRGRKLLEEAGATCIVDSAEEICNIALR